MEAVAVILVEVAAAAAVTTVGAAQVAPEDSRRWKAGQQKEGATVPGAILKQTTPQQTLPCSQGIAAASILQTSDSVAGNLQPRILCVIITLCISSSTPSVLLSPKSAPETRHLGRFRPANVGRIGQHAGHYYVNKPISESYTSDTRTISNARIQRNLSECLGGDTDDGIGFSGPDNNIPSPEQLFNTICSKHLPIICLGYSKRCITT